MTDSFAVLVRLDTELVDAFFMEAEPRRELLEAVLVPRDEALRLLLKTFPDDSADWSSGPGLRCWSAATSAVLELVLFRAIKPSIAAEPLSPLPPP